MPKIFRFEDLIAWQKAHELASRVFHLIKSMNQPNNYVLRDQLTRAAVSVPANIAEGFEVDGNREFLKFLSIAKGSAGEVRSLLFLAADLGYISCEQKEELGELSLEVSRLIGGLMRYLLSSDKKGVKFK